MARAEGAARMVTPPSQFQVRFAPEWLAWLPFVWANYWVIDLADDYSYAVVSEPDREYLWLLARDPRMSDAVPTRASSRACGRWDSTPASCTATRRPDGADGPERAPR